MDDILRQLGINGPFLLSQIVNFAILFVALSLLVWKPFLRNLKSREERMAQARADAEAAGRAREESEAERHHILELAHEESRRLVAEAHEEARAEARQILREAEHRAHQLIVEAEEAVQVEREHVLSNLREEVVSLAIAATRRLLNEGLDETHQRQSLARFFSGIQQGSIELLEDVDGLRGQSITVTSAVPLTAFEHATLERDLARRLGSVPQLTYRVDAAILGGLILRIGDRVIDGSVAGQLDQLRRCLV